MRNARDLMVKIGKIVNYVLLGLGALLFVLGIVGLILGAADSDSALAGSGGNCLGYGIWLLIANLVTLFIIGKAEEMIFNGQDNVIKGSVIEIIMGVLSNNPFFILSGIFSIIIKDDINAESKKKAEATTDEQEAVVVDEAPAEAEVEATAEDEPFAEAEAEEEKKDEE